MIGLAQCLVIATVFLTQISSHVLLQRRDDGSIKVNAQVNLPQFSSPSMPDLSPSMHMPNTPNIQSPSMNLPNNDYSFSGYLSSFYNSMPGMSTITSFLKSALSYFPSGSSIYNAIASALDAVTPDYATLKALYNQVRAQIVEDKERAYRHHLEKMKIKYGYPLDNSGDIHPMGGPGGMQPMGGPVLPHQSPPGLPESVVPHSAPSGVLIS